MLVRRVRGPTQKDIRSAVETLVDNGASVETFADGLLVVADKAAVLARVNELIDGIEAAGRPAWAVQLYLVTLTNDDLNELGFDVTPTVEVGVDFANAAARGSSLDASAGLSAVLRAARERNTSHVIAEPFFYLVDGEQAEFKRVRRVPIPISTLTETGQFITSAYESFEVGTEVNVNVREVGPAAILLRCDVVIADLRSVSSEGFPESDSREYRSAAVCHSGGVYLVGSIDISEDRASHSTWLRFGERAKRGSEVMQIWARCVSVDSSQGSLLP